MGSLKYVLCVEAVMTFMAVGTPVACVADRALPNEPLHLSPLIDQGHIHTAQNLSLVTGFGHNLESYSGYLTVDSRYCSNMFFWFFPAERKPADAPVLLWLNGGPGVSSLVGAFLENGPLAFTELGTTEPRSTSWTKYFSMLYVDNPVGTGYSYTMHDNGYSTCMTDVAANLYSVLVQFFKMFPSFSGNDLYLGGQSYAGKYVPALARYIHDRNHHDSDSPDVFINLKGIYIGGGFCDPAHMLPVFADQLYYAGIMSDYDRRIYSAKLRALIQRGTNITPSEIMSAVFGFQDSTLVDIGDLDNLLGYKATNTPLLDPLTQKLFMKESAAMRHILHVGNASQEPSVSNVISKLLAQDIFRDSNAENAFLMDNNYKVLHFSGNLDLVVSAAMTEAFLDNVQWSGRGQYRNSSRQRWFVNGELAGWVNIVGNFSRVIVRNAGHMVPYDQPTFALHMMKSFIFDEPLENVSE